MGHTRSRKGKAYVEREVHDAARRMKRKKKSQFYRSRKGRALRVRKVRDIVEYPKDGDNKQYRSRNVLCEPAPS
jgi:hypothetical protein